MRKTHLWLLSMALLIVGPALWLTKAQTQKPQSEHKAIPAASEPQSEGQPCAGGAPTMTFLEAREAFVKQGLKIRSEGKVVTPRDLIGGIMILTPLRSWLYVTNVEFRYDSNASALAYARLEGYLPDGTAVREDSTQKLPASFRLINNLAEVGAAMVELGGAQQKVLSVSYSITKRGLTLVQLCDWCQSTEDPGDGGGGGGPTCRMTASGNCNAVFCTDVCKAVSGDPCDCSGWGFCYSIPGGSCQGTCPEGSNCHMYAPNPGQFFCACLQ